MGTPVSTYHLQFGQKIQSLRDAHHMSQEELAYQMGIDRSYVGFLERGERNITLTRILKLAEIFEIPLIDLFP